MKYVLVHKFWVTVGCFRVGLFWRGLKHDSSKLLPSEFMPYANFFGEKINRARDKTGYYKPTETGDAAFELAWLKHQNRNDHHWQYWVCPTEDGEKLYEMPDKAILEMLCDWYGAGRAQGTESSVLDWWKANQDKMRFAPGTKYMVQYYLLRHKLFKKNRGKN